MNQRMNTSIRIFSVAFLLVPCIQIARGVDVEDVLKVMPSDLPISIVITDVNKFDKSLQGFITSSISLNTNWVLESGWIFLNRWDWLRQPWTDRTARYSG